MNLFQEDPTITFTATNPADNNQAIIFVGVAAVLNVTLNNATGNDLTMQPGASASTLEIFMPSFFSTQEKSLMTITDISQTGWTGAYYPQDDTLLLTFTGTKSTWPNTSSLTFNINNVVSAASPTMDDIQVNINNIDGKNVPGQVSQNLTLNKPVTPGNADLTKVLDVTLDNQGSVFVSVKQDPLSNTLTLNFKNFTDNPLYNDTNPWTGNPVVTVTFVYGKTVGALAPDEKSDSTVPGSAWLISASADSSQNWGFKNPVVTDQANAPEWTLYPNPTNKNIIGTGTEANISFQFSNINSFTPAGHTQMYVQFAGFPATSTKQYDSALFVVDIIKQPPPPTRGLISFFSPAKSVITLAKPQQNISIPLKWYMYYVDKVKMICNIPGVDVVTIDYYAKGTMVPLGNDGLSLTIPVLITQTTPVFITLQAFDHKEAYLNSLQFTVFITTEFFADPLGNVYPTLFLNNQTWLAVNYNFYSMGAVPYAQNSANQAQYGLLYTYQAAYLNTPPGWRIPTQADWQALIDKYGADAYTALMAGGSSGLNAQLGGNADTKLNFSGLASFGYYWASTPDGAHPGNYFMMAFYGSSLQKVNVQGSFPAGYSLSVRYVKNT